MTSLDLSGGEESQRRCLGFGVGLGFEKVKDGEFRINGDQFKLRRFVLRNCFVFFFILEP